jgi:hypothetical protein
MTKKEKNNWKQRLDNVIENALNDGWDVILYLVVVAIYVFDLGLICVRLT